VGGEGGIGRFALALWLSVFGVEGNDEGRARARAKARARARARTSPGPGGWARGWQ
jgi:hypothetical protein